VRQRTVYLSPWRVDVTVRDGVPRVAPVAALCRSVARALAAAGAPAPASIGLVLSDDAELTVLNRTHMGAEGPTDVLSFPLLPPNAFPAQPGRTMAPRVAVDPFVAPPGRPHLGDIVVSVERAVEQASEGRGGQTGDIRWSAATELQLLVTHGALHVCGWDHAEPGEEAAMRALEQRLLPQAG
jgi:probable rRNA maturation factor